MGGPLHRTNVKWEECWGEAGRWGYYLAVNCQTAGKFKVRRTHSAAKYFVEFILHVCTRWANHHWLGFAYALSSVKSQVKSGRPLCSILKECVTWQQWKLQDQMVHMLRYINQANSFLSW